MVHPRGLIVHGFYDAKWSVRTWCIFRHHLHQNMSMISCVDCVLCVCNHYMIRTVVMVLFIMRHCTLFSCNDTTKHVPGSPIRFLAMLTGESLGTRLDEKPVIHRSLFSFTKMSLNWVAPCDPI